MRELGRSGIRVSSVGLGCWQLSRGQGLVGRYWPALSREAERAIVRAALAEGINWFDTAEVYGGGASERALAAALEAAGAAGNDAVIATKWWPLLRTAGTIRASLDRSRRALGGRRIDLYQVHQRFSTSSISRQMDALASLVKGGHARAIGVSNFNARAMRAAHEALLRHGVPLASNQVRYSLLDRRIERNGVMEAAKDLGITIIAYSPIAQGLLSGKFHRDPELIRLTPGPRRRLPAFGRRSLARTRPLIETLEQVGAAHAATAASVALAWLTSFHGATVVAIPGAMTPEQVRANAAGMRLALTAEDLERIGRASLDVGS